jgi:LysR family glycine cleavage system transcriptional activator
LSRSRWQTLPRIACDWPAHDSLAPTWERYDNVAGSSGPGAGRTVLRFREELHGIEAVIAGQGIGILSDLLVARELESGVLVSLSTVTLEGYGIYLVLSPGQLSLPPMREFADWMRAVYADPAPPQKTRLVGTEPYQP